MLTVLFQQLVNDLSHAVRQSRDQLANGLRLAIPVSFDLVRPLLAVGEHHFAGEHEIHRRPQAVEVGTAIDLEAVTSLLGCDVVGRAQTILAEDHGQRELIIEHRFRGHGQPKIQNVRVAQFIHQDVGRLEVAVNQPVAMRVLQPSRDMLRDVTRDRPRDRSAESHELVDADATDQIHHHVVNLAVESG